ncbi:DUF4083 domain-containing protein [Bacillus sp. PS06]|uniref:DUF4083 domain-containing protein n=1 Tax=Bacillus sp. PS06 TaxID=2764176 RepID=UPI001CD8C734|nr:DUF4083 domain-containing protein [Bacillus sp. PS06]
MANFNLGDALYQLIVWGFLILLIVLIVTSVRLNKGRRNQLDRIEKKLDDVNEQLKKVSSNG